MLFLEMKKQFGFEDGSYQAAGQEAGLQLLVEAFYRQMDELPEAKGIREMHKADLTEAKDKLFRFLSGWLGGPKLYQEKYGPISIPIAHRHFPIGPAERDAWLLCMQKALAEQPYESDFKSYLLYQLSIPAERVRTKD